MSDFKKGMGLGIIAYFLASHLIGGGVWLTILALVLAGWLIFSK